MIEETRNRLLRGLSPQDFLALGIQQVAYIRPVMIEGAHRFALHAADGTRLAFHDNEALAKALARQNDLEPVTVH
jgi:hypothetical protein